MNEIEGHPHTRQAAKQKESDEHQKDGTKSGESLPGWLQELLKQVADVMLL